MENKVTKKVTTAFSVIFEKEIFGYVILKDIQELNDSCLYLDRLRAVGTNTLDTVQTKTTRGRALFLKGLHSRQRATDN